MHAAIEEVMKMRRVLIMVAAVAVLAVPVNASAAVNPTDFKNASKFCKALKAEMEQSAPGSFKLTFGTNKNRSNAHGKCVSKHAKTVDQIHASAVEQCKSTNAKPLGKCVRSTEKQKQAAATDEIVNAAKECRAERALDADAFRDKYGTNRNKRNAFGKCVSATVKENREEASQS
jgi:hypothetical protein